MENIQTIEPSEAKLTPEQKFKAKEIAAKLHAVKFATQKAERYAKEKNIRIVCENGEGGICVTQTTGAEPLEEVIKKVVPKGVPYKIVDVKDIPQSRMLRNAWSLKDEKVEIDIPKGKLIAHAQRREERTREISPLDDLIAKKIPGTNNNEVEEKRQVIRDKNAAKQDAIEAAADPDQLMEAMKK